MRTEPRIRRRRSPPSESTYGEKIRGALADVGIEVLGELVAGLVIVLPLTLLLTLILSLLGVGA